MYQDQVLLKVEKISKTYGRANNKTEALKDVSFVVHKGEFLSIMGASGSGKTTLLNCIATLTRPDQGRILLKRQDIFQFRDSQLAKYRGTMIGYLFQTFELLDNLTAGENILLPLALHGLKKETATAGLEEIAALFNIGDVLNKFPAQLSGGEKQRVAAARALIADPFIVLADEPTGALDSKNSRVLLDKLSLINSEQQKTILMVTHNASVASYCTRILFIEDGRIVHELRRDRANEDNTCFYERIVTVVTQLGGGSGHVL